MQTDIEIYLLSCSTENIMAWLEEEFVLIKKNEISKLCSKVIVNSNGSDIEVTILKQAAGKRFTSVWFDSDQTPWKNDIDCAKQAFKSLNCEVRCNLQTWEEGGEQDPDQWWQINAHGEGPFIWN